MMKYVGIFIVGLFLGIVASFVYLKPVATAPSGENTYQAGFNAAKKLVQDSDVGAVFRTPDDIRTIAGVVTAIDGNRIVIHTQSRNPFDDPALLERLIVVTKDTKITKTSPGDTKAFQAEMEAFIKKTQAGQGAGLTSPRPPVPIKTIVDVSSIVEGDTLTVTAGENVKIMKEFSASEIQI